MELVIWKRQQNLHKQHLQRVRGMNPCIDTSCPSSLGLKHLATRAKKKQLIEDQQQRVAKDNKVLMDNMMSIMAEERNQGVQTFSSSLNERERRFLYFFYII